MPTLDELKAEFPRPNIEEFNPANSGELRDGVLGVFFDVAIGLAKKLVDETKAFLEKMAKKEWFLQSGLRSGEIDRTDYAEIRADTVRALKNFLLMKKVMFITAIDSFVDSLLRLFDAVLLKRLG